MTSKKSKKGTPDLIHGTLDMLILRTLQGMPAHGWAISKAIAVVSGRLLEVNQGSIYPALYRLEDRGWVRAGPGKAKNGRTVKVYEITLAGAQRLVVEQEHWEQFSRGVLRVMRGGNTEIASK